MEIIKLEADESIEGLRLDKALADSTDEFLSRSFIQKLIKDNAVLVNNKIQKASYKLSLGDEIEFEIPDARECVIEPEDIKLDILYEDNDIIIINKPKDMVVHPANGHMSGTLVNALLYHCRDSLSGINGIMRPGIVHRIDKDTTGSIIVCKNDLSHIKVANLLKEHDINRSYRAICHGNIVEDELTIDAPIGRSEKDRKKMAVNAVHGKRAVTHVSVLERFGDYTYVECRLETGRTHQIRVHMMNIGHPILGDEVYSGRKSPFKTNGQCLHAYKLGLIHPTTGEYIESIAPIPEYMEKILNSLRIKYSV